LNTKTNAANMRNQMCITPISFDTTMWSK
jgi:hypothetical protein